MVYKFVTTKKRSELMSKIRSNNTSPEVVLRKKLWGAGVRFNRKPSKLPGKPDIVISKHNVIVFIDGEFWHGYDWKKKKKKIKANRGYWIPKIERNVLRDKKANKELRKNGWKVVRFWEHQIKKDTAKCLKKIYKLMEKN